MKELTSKEMREIKSLLEVNGSGVHEIRVLIAALDKGLLSIKTIEESVNNQKVAEKNSVVKVEKEEILDEAFNVDETLPDYFIHSKKYPCKGTLKKVKKMLGWAVSCQQDVINYYDNKMVVENLFGKEFNDIFSILEIKKEKNIIELNEILNIEGFKKTSFIDCLKFYSNYQKDKEFKGRRLFSSEDILNNGISNIQKNSFLLPVKINGSIMFQPLTNNLGIPILKFPANSLILIKEKAVL